MATIAEIAAGSPDFDILLAAIGFVDSEIPDANLATTLDTATDLTVFAPTDAAFTDLALDLGFTGDPQDEDAVATFLVTTLDAQTLLDTILYHVSAGEQSAAQIEASASIATLNGAAITPEGPTLGDLEPDLIDASIVTPDVAADNGVIHVIDKVMLPFDVAGNDAPTITGIVASSGGTFDTDNGDFDILLNAVLAAGLEGALDDPSADLTAFAPTDAAFVGLAQTLGYQGMDEAGAFNHIVEALTLLSGGGDPIPLLTNVLLYHVAPQSLQASQVLSSSSIETLLGADLGVSGAQLVDADPDLADPTIIATDIQAANGIVHVIDGVLIPTDILVSDGTGTVDFIIGDDTGELIGTRRDADLVSAQGGDDMVYLGDGDDLALGGDGNDILSGGDGNDSLSGDAGDDTVAGKDGDDELSGGDGNDLVEGGGGNDTMKGDQGDDLLNGRQGDDRMLGGNGSDELNGASGNDTLKGLNGDDLIRAGEGEDVVYGGDGNDTVRGGDDADTFVFSSGTDLVVDFEAGIDTLLIDSALLSDLNDLASFVDAGADDLTLDFGGGNTLILQNIDDLATVTDDIGLG